MLSRPEFKTPYQEITAAWRNVSLGEDAGVGAAKSWVSLSAFR